jgi:signal transduction histidine kinase/ligand-binding sensor domain-containing protein
LVISSAQTVDDQPKLTPESLHQWGAVTLFHGLPSDRVRAITQDNEGTIWFGTDAGLARFDGRRTQTIIDPALPPGHVQALQLDQAGALWIGTEGGAARMLAGQIQLVKETEGKSINAVLAPEPGRIILATSEGTIFELAVQGNDWTVRQTPAQPMQNNGSDKPEPVAFTSLAADGAGLIAGSRGRGLITITGAEAKEIEEHPRESYVEALKRDPGGRLWMGTRTTTEQGGLFDATDPQHPVRFEGLKGTVNALQTDALGRLWAGTDNQGVFQLQGTQVLRHFTFQNTAGGLRSDQIFSIFVDREQVVWFGTNRGVCRYDPQAWRLETVSASRESSFVRAIFRGPDGRLWCGTSRGLFVQEPAKTEWRTIPELAQKTIYAINLDAGGRLMAGTASGLFVANSSGSFKLITGTNPAEIGNSIRAIAVFQGKTYVAVYGYGIEAVDGDHYSPVWPNGPPDPRALETICLFAQPGGPLWVGTATGGAYLFDGEQTVREPALSELEGSAVRSIDGPANGLVWLATSRGLFVFRDNKLQPLLPGVDTRSVLVAGDRRVSQRVWCATAGLGLVKIALDAPTGPISTTFDPEQGLPSPSVYALAQEGGEGHPEALVIGTYLGLAHYEPSTIPPLETPARIIGKRLYSLDEVRKGLWLEYPQNSLLVDIAAASSRTFPEQFQYVFTLFDSAGRIIKQKRSRESQFSMEALPAGSYRMQAIAYNADLVPSAPFEITFNIPRAPFPWTVAALSLLLLLALFALLWANFEHHRIARTSTELANANQELADARLRLANEAESERRRIARDLHDQTLADLRRLMLMTDQLPAENGSKTKGLSAAAAVRQEIESVSNEIRRICEDLSPSVLENVGLAAALEFALVDAVTHLPEDRKFTFEFACPEDLEDRLGLPASMKMQVYRIAQEAISNICRHAQAKHVRFTVTLDAAGELSLVIDDDGIGMRDKEPNGWRGRGLANIRARAGLIDAEAVWTDGAKGGTVFTLRKTDAGA